MGEESLVTSGETRVGDDKDDDIAVESCGCIGIGEGDVVDDDNNKEFLGDEAGEFDWLCEGV